MRAATTHSAGTTLFTFTALKCVCHNFRYMVFSRSCGHAFSERGIQNNRAEGRGDHTRSAGGVPLRGHKGSSKGSEQDAAQATCTLAACARRVALSLPFFA